MDSDLKKLHDTIFNKIVKRVKVADFSPEEFKAYRDNLRYYRDIQNSLDTAREEGIKEGMEKGIKEGIEEGIKEGRRIARKREITEIAKKLKSTGVSIEMIARVTKLPQDKVENL